MKIEYKLTPSDMIKIEKHQKAIARPVFSLHRSFWAKLLWSILVLIWFIPAVIFVANLPARLGFWLLYIVLIPIFVVIVATYVLKRKYYKFLQSELQDDSIRTITINDNGVVSTSGQSNSVTPWNRIRQIWELEDYILFILPIFNCLAVPTCIFNDKDQMAEFLNEAHSKRNNAIALNKRVYKDAR